MPLACWSHPSCEKLQSLSSAFAIYSLPASLSNMSIFAVTLVFVLAACLVEAKLMCQRLGCDCPGKLELVCGKDGKTYGNECLLDCHGVELDRAGPCGRTCDRICQRFGDDVVCGADGNNYANRCYARCYKVDVASEGTCPCICPFILNPVCGSNGQEMRNFDNACLAACEGFNQTITSGRCPCVCPFIYIPVCGSDGKNYDNSCQAECAGVTYTEGRCPCACPFSLIPVCGVDGNTYDGSCQAECAGVEVAYDGACE